MALPKSATNISSESGLHWQNKGTRVFHCYAGSPAYNQTVNSGFVKVDIVGIDEEHKDEIDLKYIALGGNKTVKAGLFRDFPIERIDLNNDIVEIGKNAFNDKTLIQVKKGTFGDKWCKENGYYLCEVISDLNTYTKDRSKRIEEDFTRILSDDSPWAEWTSHKFKIQEPLKLEEVDDKLVLTSFMLRRLRSQPPLLHREQRSLTRQAGRKTRSLQAGKTMSGISRSINSVSVKTP